MKKLLFVVIILLLSSNLFATEQIKDSLVYNGKGYYIEKQFEFLFEDELRLFVEERNTLPEDFFYTALWRRYVAVFEIANNRLLLKELNALVYNEIDSTAYYKNIVTKELQERIKSENFSGVLILTDESDDYDFFNPDNIYNPNYKILEFSKSILSKELDFKYEEYDDFKKNQFEKYKNTNFYRKDLRNCKKSKKQSLNEYLKSNQTQMAEYEKRLDCSNFIKAFLFENPFYTHIL